MPPQGGFPRLGSRVNAGDVLAFVQPALSAADATTQQQQARELDQQITLVERRLERLRPLSNIVARSQIEDAELELRGLRQRRANLDRAPREPERLVAPVSGVIAAVQAVAGQIAEPNAIIFQIVDPRASGSRRSASRRRPSRGRRRRACRTGEAWRYPIAAAA